MIILPPYKGDRYLVRIKGFISPLRSLVMVLAVLLFVVSCGHKRRPAGVLSHQQMVKVLSEIYITEEKVNRLALKHDSTVKVFDRLKGKMFDKLSTTDSTFKRSMNYYWNNPDELELIYTALVDSLNLREQRLSLPPSDSIK